MGAWVLSRGALRRPPIPGGWLLFSIPAIAWKVISNAAFPLAMIGLPLLGVLVFADLLLWRDRARFRLFAKIVLFSGTVQAFLVAALIAGGQILRGLAWLDWTNLRILAVFNLGMPWSNLLIALIFSWQFLLILIGLRQRRFASLLPPRERARRALVVAVCAGWLLSLHLTLTDCLLGWRFITGIWGESLG
ncbi:MAG TPA: hypothetical protein P5572_18860 [Phycisphaerae bacterium]|nr:hypothetical protein [Phycisphaerae bacterium]